MLRLFLGIILGVAGAVIVGSTEVCHWLFDLVSGFLPPEFYQSWLAKILLVVLGLAVVILIAVILLAIVSVAAFAALLNKTGWLGAILGHGLIHGLAIAKGKSAKRDELIVWIWYYAGDRTLTRASTIINEVRGIKPAKRTTKPKTPERPTKAPNVIRPERWKDAA